MENSLDLEIEKYVESKRNVWSDRTLVVLRSVLWALAVDFIYPAKNYQKLLKRGLSKHTIRSYFLYAIRFEEETFGTISYREFLKKNRSTFKNCYKDRTKILKPDQYEKFIAGYLRSNPRMYNLLILMGRGGLRISEALSARWDDLKDGVIWVVGKGDKQRQIPFDKKHLHPVEGKKICGDVSYRYFFNRDMKPFTPHDFRAFFATSVANHPELNIKDAAMLLGHNSIHTTSRYVRSDFDRVAKVLNS